MSVILVAEKAPTAGFIAEDTKVSKTKEEGLFVD